MIRCWECDKIIVTPDTINGEKGVAGIIRAGGVDRALVPQTVTIELTCTCGAQYTLTTSRKPGRAKPWTDGTSR